MNYPLSQICSTDVALQDALQAMVAGKQVFLITDEIVSENCLPIVLPFVNDVAQAEVIEIEPGEQSKSLDVARHILEHLHDSKADRDAVIINLGGGVVSDLGGFVASIYKRGISYVNIPTSLMGMVDAAIGGKTAVNLSSAKNVVGSFYLPKAVLVFPEFLETLRLHQLKSGFAEMLKHAIISSDAYWKQLTKISDMSAEEIAPLVKASVACKELLVQKDLLDENVRMTLNFGHSLGHAIESCFLELEMPITHGESVALGMIIETKISAQLHHITTNEAEEIVNGIAHYFDPGSFTMPPINKIMKFLSGDKKNKAGELRMALPFSIGKVDYNQVVTVDIVEKVYNDFTA